MGLVGALYSLFSFRRRVPWALGFPQIHTVDIEAALIFVQLAAPMAVLVAPIRKLLVTVVLVFCIQVLTIWYGGCVTFTWQCSIACKWISGTCEQLGDNNDAAPFGIAFLALLSLVLLAVTTLVKWLYTQWREKTSE